MRPFLSEQNPGSTPSGVQATITTDIEGMAQVLQAIGALRGVCVRLSVTIDNDPPGDAPRPDDVPSPRQEDMGRIKPLQNGRTELFAADTLDNGFVEDYSGECG